MSKVIVLNPLQVKVIISEVLEEQLEVFKQELNADLNPKEDFVTIKEAASILKVSELTIRNYIKRGILTANKIGRRVLIDSDVLNSSLSNIKSLKYKR